MRLLSKYIHKNSKILLYDYSTDYLLILLISRFHLYFALNSNSYKDTTFVVKSVLVSDFNPQL